MRLHNIECLFCKKVFEDFLETDQSPMEAGIHCPDSNCGSEFVAKIFVGNENCIVHFAKGGFSASTMPDARK